MLRAQPLSHAAGVGTRLRHEPLQRVWVGKQVSIKAPQPQDPPHVAAVPHRHTGVVRQGLRCRLRRGGGGCSVGTNGAAAVGGVQVSEERVSELPLGPQNREPDGQELPQREQQLSAARGAAVSLSAEAMRIAKARFAVECDSLTRITRSREHAPPRRIPEAAPSPRPGRAPSQPHNLPPLNRALQLSWDRGDSAPGYLDI